MKILFEWIFIIFYMEILFGSSNAHGYDPRESHSVIVNSLHFANTSSPLCSRYPCCSISATELCYLSMMPKNTSTLVLPGGSTRCIFSYSTPYAFQVIPGANDKLLFYFQAGGACWDESSTVSLPLCVSDVEPTSQVGVFDRSEIDNRYRDFTVVLAMYCSGDIWGGNVTRSYKDSDGVPVSQQGYTNAQSTLDWIKEQQASGFLTPVLTDLVLMGASAGSLGVQIWSNEVLKELKWESASVVADSFAGLFPDGIEGPLIKSFGFCDVKLINNYSVSGSGSAINLKELCDGEKLTMSAITSTFIEMNPAVPFAFVQSKEDAVQISYYFAIAISNLVNPLLSPKQFYDGVNDILSDYSQKYKNVVVYMIDGIQHMFTPLRLYYHTDPQGPDRIAFDTANGIIAKTATTTTTTTTDVSSTTKETSFKSSDAVVTYSISQAINNDNILIDRRLTANFLRQSSQQQEDQQKQQQQQRQQQQQQQQQQPNGEFLTANNNTNNNASSSSLPSLVNWMNILPMDPGESVSSVCEGPAKERGLDYCSPDLFPKEFVQSNSSMKQSQS